MIPRVFCFRKITGIFILVSLRFNANRAPPSAATGKKKARKKEMQMRPCGSNCTPPRQTPLAPLLARTAYDIRFVCFFSLAGLFLPASAVALFNHLPCPFFFLPPSHSFSLTVSNIKMAHRDLPRHQTKLPDRVCSRFHPAVPRAKRPDFRENPAGSFIDSRSKLLRAVASTRTPFSTPRCDATEPRARLLTYSRRIAHQM